MKVVGLLSGGKDSCYNLVHCVQQGHELVALATLAPPGSKDELDSYMYQTVGHDAVHLVAEAMGLPLYRRVIRGTALNQQSEYGSRAPTSSTSTSADETEDLFHLLLDVKTHHPDIDAVSVGAILSNYQRVRVEHVALRPELNLTPLTFLWQRSQSELYAEMLRAGLVSVLIKVAGIGLDERDLGKTLGQMHGKLERLARMYGAHVCGEGGEYETLTLDSPLFRRRIELGEVERVVHSDSAFGSVSYLRLKNARLVDKEDAPQGSGAITPPLLDRLGRKTLRAAAPSQGSEEPVGSVVDKLDSLHLDNGLHFPPGSIRRKGRYVVLSNITGLATTSALTPTTPEDQISNAFATARHLLAAHGLDLSHLSHINLYLRSQALFARVNAVYRTLFGVSPPTRACVALPSLPPGCDVVLHAIGFDDRDSETAFDRRALHVQGRSFWAPANIGPYSQSVVHAEKVWVAGQIGLVPADLTLPSGKSGEGNGEELQTALSLQHARRILKATLNDMGGRSVEKGWVEGGVCWIEQGEGRRVEMVRRAWVCQGAESDDEGEEPESESEAWLGQTDAPEQKGILPPMLFVTLPMGALPRGAAVEWQVTAHTGRVPPPLSDPPANPSEEDDDDVVGSDAFDVRTTRTATTLTHASDTFELVHTTTASIAAQSSFGLLTLRQLPLAANQTEPATSTAAEAFRTSLQACLTTAYATQLFLPSTTAQQGEHNEASTLLHELLSTQPELVEQAQVIPCSSLHTLTLDMSAQPVDLALVWHGL